MIQSGDTLDAIVQAYKEKNIKVTVAQILKANPGLKAERLRVGQKIFIPAPAALSALSPSRPAARSRSRRPGRSDTSRTR